MAFDGQRMLDGLLAVVAQAGEMVCEAATKKQEDHAQGANRPCDRN